MEPLAYLLTWTTYGTWLQGDERGWVQSGEPGIRAPDATRLAAVRQRMTEPPVILDDAQRLVVDKTIREHCRIRRWALHAVNVRSNHVHLVVTADALPEVAMRQFKAWCSRRLTEHASDDRVLLPSKNGQRRWWTEHGSTKWINDEAYLHNAIRYVNERQ